MPAQQQKYCMAIPDAEYMRVLQRFAESPHTSSFTLLSAKHERVRFIRLKNDKVVAERIIDGNTVPFDVMPLSEVAKGQQQSLKAEWKKAHPDWDDARIEAEMDCMKEMRKSVETLSKELKCSPEQAYKILERAMVEKEVADKMSNVKLDRKQVEADKAHFEATGELKPLIIDA